MAYTYKILANGTSTSASISTFNLIYTVPSGKSVIISRIDLTDLVGSNAGALLRIIPSGATEGTSHNYGVASTGAGAKVQQNSMGTYAGPITLSAGDTIKLATSSANAVSYHIFGVEIS